MRIAIVEDQAKDRKLLLTALKRYAAENRQIVQVDSFENAEQFLDHYRPLYDVVFMDIVLPATNGMEAAARLRELDRSVALIFTTDMRQYAIQGYRVGALDYFLKPVNYFDLKMRMDMIALSRHDRKKTISVHVSRGGERRLCLEDIYYIEVMNRDLTYHTTSGELMERRTLKSLEQELDGEGFRRCSASFLVNLRWCTGLSGDSVLVAGQSLKISRGMRQDFLAHLSEAFPQGMENKRRSRNE